MTNNEQVSKFHLEIRACDTFGSIESTDTFTGTEQAAIEDAKNWLNEALSLDPYQKEILVINVETEECIYQGTFNLVPHMPKGFSFIDQNGLTVHDGSVYGIDENGDLYDIEPLIPFKPSEY